MSRARSRTTTAGVLLVSLATIASSAGAAAPARPDPGAPPDTPVVPGTAAPRPPGPGGMDLVRNGSAGGGTAGWRAGSDAGPVRLRAARADSPAGSGGIQVSRSGGAGTWAMALSALRTPDTLFAVGRTYRMQAWVRQLSGGPAAVGMLLANANYAHRPSTVTATGRITGGWQLLSRTFVCTSTAHPDTALYFSLPASGAFDLQITGASVRPVAAALPHTVGAAPTRTIGFAGPAGSAPDPAVWNHETGGSGWGHDELQTYTSQLANAHLDGAGRLRLVARRDRVAGADGITRDFTSARLSTQDKVSVAPGSYLESAIVAPTGDGAWPAFWLVGANIGIVRWPACGELDILEGWGDRRSVAHSAVHLAAADDPHAHRQYGWDESGASTDLGQPLDAAAHRYGVYFDNDVVRFYIDRRPTMTIWAHDAAVAGRAWPFGSPQFIVVNVAVPARTRTGSAAFPKTMSVGAISVWQGGVPAG